nr:T9SS type A sorting domain-containing protein [Cytophagales bacterium]
VTIKLQALPSGVYFLRLLTSEASQQLKWIKR